MDLKERRKFSKFISLLLSTHFISVTFNLESSLRRLKRDLRQSPVDKCLDRFGTFQFLLLAELEKSRFTANARLASRSPKTQI